MRVPLTTVAVLAFSGAALAQQGWLRETLRLPMTPVSEACNQNLALQLERVMKLEKVGVSALAA